MNTSPNITKSARHSRAASQTILLLLATLLTIPSLSALGAPRRLVLALDSIAYRDVKALQEGITYKDRHGKLCQLQGFHQGYFPVSRLVSTFPSASDVAWTEIFGNRPLPGYQRTYFSIAANQEIWMNGVTSSMEYEKQMTWRVNSSVHNAMGYVRPRKTFQYEADKLVEDFLNTTSPDANYYAYFVSTDSAQHMACDIFTMLATLDKKLTELRARYLAREGRELEVLILSDHANNHTGAGQRVQIRSYLKKAGYRITKSLLQPKDVVLPTAGIESWVELHNQPAETEQLVELLSHLQGVDVLSAQIPGETNRFIVMNSKGERASIAWDTANNSFRYAPESGDPLNYRPVLVTLAQKGQLDVNGYAASDAWMAETLPLRYPLALERIAWGHTRAALNPATILISLNDGYVHADWLVRAASRLARFGGTHGGLDDLDSNGMLLSSFAPTQDTSTRRVASCYGGFAGLREYRTNELGAEWITAKAQALTLLPRGSLDWGKYTFSGDQVFLHVWTPGFSQHNRNASVEVRLGKVLPLSNVLTLWGCLGTIQTRKQHLMLKSPVAFSTTSTCEHLYPLPPDLLLEPHQTYQLSGRIPAQTNAVGRFKFTFRTDDRGQPVPY
ncbi:MAG: hypothetical protein WCO56_10335 [Verrucomicrobiota bacterium]